MRVLFSVSFRLRENLCNFTRTPRENTDKRERWEICFINRDVNHPVRFPPYISTFSRRWTFLGWLEKNGDCISSFPVADTIRVVPLFTIDSVSIFVRSDSTKTNVAQIAKNSTSEGRSG